MNALSVIAICVILAVIIVSDIFCEDFSLKTIKTLFVRPNKRSSIFISKIATSLLVYLYFSLLVIVVSFIATLFLYDINIKNEIVLYINASGEIAEKTYALYFFQQSLCVLVEGSTYILLAIMCAAISKNAAITSVISVVCIMGANAFLLFFEEKSQLIKYILFYNTDLSQYLNNGTNYWNTGMMFSTCVIVIYCATFLFISNYFFCKKDIY